MGTPNFQSPNNAKDYYVVLTSNEETYKECEVCFHRHYEELDTLTECENECKDATFEENTETRYPEEFECDDLKGNIGCDIEAQGGTSDDKCLDSSQYSVTSLGYLNESKCYGDVEVEVKVTAVLCGAYYEGATLDYLVQIVSQQGDDFDISTGSRYDEDVDDVMTQLFDEYNTYMNAGLRKIQSQNAEKWVENIIEELSEKMDNLIQGYSEHKLSCKGVMSNGEAIYESVN